jgi:DNA polymerase-3 subunit gamma/tau
MGFYNKYRPQTFAEVEGNTETIQSLQTLIKKGNAPHAFLLTGPTGCGKTTIGRIIAKELGCSGTDYQEINTADFRGIDTIRELRKRINYKPIESKVRVFLIDEVHKLSNDAQNAILKPLESTPSHVYFILATTDPEKLLKTVRGRCATYEVELLSRKQVFKVLKKIVKAENETLEKEIYEQIYQSTQGHGRNAVQLLEQVLQVPSENRLKAAEKYEQTQAASIELARALVQGKSWKTVSELLKGLKTEDPEGIRRLILGYCQSVLLNKQDDNVALIMEEMLEPFYNTGFPGLTYACYSITNQ